MIMIFGTFVANNDILSPGIVLHFFKILIFLVVSGVKGQKILSAVLCASYLRNHTSHCHLWCTCVKL